jgi:hypothetical protein
MTEKFLRELAAKHGISILKTVTAGNSARHFATFELYAHRDQIRSAWPAVASENRGNDFDTVRHCNVAYHPNYGHPYIECSSVWCDGM